MSDPVRVEIDLDACVGHGRCYELAPRIFGEDERGYGEVLKTLVPCEHEAEARRAAENCPEGAIRLTKDQEARP